jgi:hypothetical protein
VVMVVLVIGDREDRDTGHSPQRRTHGHGGHENSYHNQRVSHVVHRPASRFRNRSPIPRDRSK